MLRGSRAGREFLPKSSQLPLKALQREALGKEQDGGGGGGGGGREEKERGEAWAGLSGDRGPYAGEGGAVGSGKGATLGTETSPGGGFMS